MNQDLESLDALLAELDAAPLTPELVFRALEARAVLTRAEELADSAALGCLSSWVHENTDAIILAHIWKFGVTDFTDLTDALQCELWIGEREAARLLFTGLCRCHRSGLITDIKTDISLTGKGQAVLHAARPPAFRVLCVCTAGRVRSAWMAEVINKRFPCLETSTRGISSRANAWKKLLPSTLGTRTTDLILTIGPVHAAFIRGMQAARVFHGEQKAEVVAVPFMKGYRTRPEPAEKSIIRIVRRRLEPFQAKQPLPPFDETRAHECCDSQTAGPCKTCPLINCMVHPEVKDLHEGERNNGLFDLACRLVNRGLDESERLQRLEAFNAEHVHPPLGIEELTSLNRNAGASLR